MSVTQNSESPNRQQRFVPLLNTSGVSFDPYSAVEIIETDRPDSGSSETPGGGRTRLRCRVAASDNPRAVAITGPFVIAAGAEGIGTLDYPTYVKISGSPAVGDEIGLASGATALAANYTGWIFLGDLHSGRGRVIRAPGSVLASGTILAEALLAENMCYNEGPDCVSDEVVAINNFDDLGQIVFPVPTTAVNRFCLEGNTGDRVLLYKVLDNGQGGEEWRISQVIHERIEVDLVSWNSYTCSLEQSIAKFRAPSCVPSGTATPVVKFVPKDVVVDVFQGTENAGQDPLCIYIDMTRIYTPQGCQELDDIMQAICGTDCLPPESGSGSG